MRKHILISTFILLTAGCQPNSDGNLLSHNESDIFTPKSMSSSEGSVKTLQSYDVSKYDQTITKPQSSFDQNSVEQVEAPVEKSSSDVVSAKVFEAVVRLKMDLAGIIKATPESDALNKLIFNSQDAYGISFYQSLKENKIPFDLEFKPGDQVEIKHLAQAFKQVAARYGFDEGTQSMVSESILKRSALLVPMESQKVLAAVNAQLLQKKINELIYATSLNFKGFCPALKAFVTAGENFYEDKQYTLPTLIKEKIKNVKEILSSEIAACAKSGLGRSQKTIENVETAVGVVTYDFGSLELYLTPADDFNWEDFEHFPIKTFLQEAKLTNKEQLNFSDIVCTVDGKRLNLVEAKGTKKTAEFDYLVDDARPIAMLKSPAQKGVTLAFFARNMKVSNFKGMTLTKIKPDVLVPAVNIVPGQIQEFDLWFIPKSSSVESHLHCFNGGV